MSTVTVDEMRPKLLTLDQAREKFEATEPLSQVVFPLKGSPEEVAQFHLADGWNHDLADTGGSETVDATVSIAGKEYALTLDALLEATSLIGLPKKYMTKTPASLMEPHVNYWFSDGPANGIIRNQPNMKLLCMGDTAYGFAKESVEPFSNLTLLDRSLQSIQKHYGDVEVLVDYKFEHSLRATACRLIVPDNFYEPREGALWSAGVQFRNSLTGEKALSLEGYMFCWDCTNGAVSTHAQSGRWSRRTGDTADAYEWARQAVDEILGDLEHEFDAIADIASTPLENDVSTTLDDLFSTYNVPLKGRTHIIENMEETDDLTMYGLMQAVTSVANRDDISEKARNTLMEIGGDLPRATADRCSACRRLVR